LARDGMTMVIVTHEMDFARDISSRVFYMDEGSIYESGTSVQVFEAPQRNKTRAFIHRIRSFHRQITSVDFDVYALNAEVEQFGERQFLSRDERHDLVLLVEELILLHRGRSATEWWTSPFLIRRRADAWRSWSRPRRARLVRST